MRGHFLSCCVSLSAIMLSICGTCFGQQLERRPWTTSRVQGSPEPPKPFAIERVYPNLKFDQPVELAPLKSLGRMLLLEVGGKVFTFEDQANVQQADLAMDVAPLIDNFTRAFSIAVHPEFPKKNEVFICYASAPVARPDGTRLSRFRMSTQGVPTIDPNSEEILLTWASGGHNGCSIRFDNQGLMYFSAGDGARPFPPDEYDVSQDLSDLRATICRIDVDRRSDGLPYAIPNDNPFIDTPNARPEIWAYGFRNPWRFSIDPQTNRLMCGDVGWELWELVFEVERGGNYGWSIFEGPQPIRADIKPGPTPIRRPLVAYPHTEGLSVTGGFTYRGSQFPELDDVFLYGDYVTGLMWGVRSRDGTVVDNSVLAETGIPIITFSPSATDEPLVVSFNGEIYRLIENPLASAPSEFPTLLSETGLFSDAESLRPADGVYPYQVTAEAFQDGAQSSFVIGLPGETTIQSKRQKRQWKWPKDTVVAKTMQREVVVEGKRQVRRIETQLLHYDGLSWQPYCYVWNEEQSDALLIGKEGGFSEFEVPVPQDRNGSGSPLASKTLRWRHHSRAECRACHTNQTGGAVAFSYENLGGEAGWAPGRSYIDAFVALDVLDKPAPSWNLEPMVDPYDHQQPLEKRARSYLAANCAHCHCRGGGGTVALDLSYFNANDKINAIDYPTTQGNFGLTDARVVVPGHPSRSVLFYRMATSAAGHMPKLWSRDNDTAGLRLIEQWITSMHPDVGAANVAHSGHPNTTTDFLKSFSVVLNLENSQQQQEFAADLAESSTAETRGLFERFLPDEQRAQRLGNDIDPEAILAIKGDAVAGRQRFMESTVQQCRNCHRFAGQGRMVGPDLQGIAKQRTRLELLQSILDPSEKIDPQFAAQTILTLDGNLYSGLLIQRNKESLVLRLADGTDQTLATDDVEAMKPNPKSLMPDGLAAEMTAQELADLLAFLAQQN